MIGRTLSRYRILAEVGRGGMGIVYRALDERLGREVALKVLTPALLGNEDVRRRFLREARAAAALQHHAIAVVHEIDEAEGVTFIAMELVRGDKLGDVIAKGELELAERLELAIEVADGLAEAHAKGVVHRDVKPANVIVSPGGRVKIVDFGLAKLIDPLGELSGHVDTPFKHDTDPGRLMGTPAYMSPEQARGMGVDARSDVFAFGSVLFELLAGRPAFRHPTAVETLHAILKEPAPALPDLGPGTDTARTLLQALLAACQAKEPERRPDTMKEVAASLRVALRRLEHPAEEPAASERAEPGQAAWVARVAGAKLRVVIVDDEDLARRVMREYLSSRADVEIVAECRNGFEAVKAAAEASPDLLFLDIQMPKLTGFEVLELIDREIGVVFVTAYDEFALKAFEVHAVDYLLKPVAPERLHEAVDRAKARFLDHRPAPVREAATAVQAAAGPAQRILVRQGAKVDVIPVEKLDYAQAQDDYVSLRAEGRDYLKEQTLGELERTLDARSFVRIHRSYLLNVARLARVEPYAKDSRVAILQDGTRLPVSRAGYARLKTLL